MPFQKGQSGNPLGRPKGAAGIARYISEQTNDCRELVDRLLDLARDDGASTRERFGAVTELLSRAIGKPMQPSEVALAVTSEHALIFPQAWPEMSPSERASWLLAHRARLLAAGDS